MVSTYHSYLNQLVVGGCCPVAVPYGQHISLLCDHHSTCHKFQQSQCPMVSTYHSYPKPKRSTYVVVSQCPMVSTYHSYSGRGDYTSPSTGRSALWSAHITPILIFGVATATWARRSALWSAHITPIGTPIASPPPATSQCPMVSTYHSYGIPLKLGLPKFMSQCPMVSTYHSYLLWYGLLNPYDVAVPYGQHISLLFAFTRILAGAPEVAVPYGQHISLL